jgi:hypothetical protein
MRWQYQALTAALVATLAGCGPRDNTAGDTGSAADQSGTTPGVTGSTGMTDTTSVGGTAGTGMTTDTEMAKDTGKAHTGHDTGKATTPPAKPDSGT